MSVYKDLITASTMDIVMSMVIDHTVMWIEYWVIQKNIIPVVWV